MAQADAHACLLDALKIDRVGLQVPPRQCNSAFAILNDARRWFLYLRKPMHLRMQINHRARRNP